MVGWRREGAKTQGTEKKRMNQSKGEERHVKQDRMSYSWCGVARKSSSTRLSVL